MIGISYAEFEQVRRVNLTLKITNRYKGRITGVTLEKRGILGGKHHKNRPIIYRLFIDLTNLTGRSIPTIYVLYPGDLSIKHCNIWSPKHCSMMDRRLPYLCMGTNSRAWKKEKDRTFGNLLFLVSQVLSKQNKKSPARLNI